MRKSRLDIILNFLKTGRGGKEAADSLKGVEKSQKEADAGAKKLKLAQLGLAISIAGVTLSAVKQIPEMFDLGFKYRNAQIALDAYAGSAAEAEQITLAVASAAGFAIDKFTAVQNATRLLSLGLAETAEQAGKVTKTAITLGATMGKEATGAFEEFTLLLANQSILRLDTFGISAGKVRERMAELAEEFPELDRNARFTNATLEIAEEKMVLLEEAGFQATSSLDVLRAKVSDLGLVVGEVTVDKFGPYIDVLLFVAGGATNPFVDAINDQIAAMIAAGATTEELNAEIDRLAAATLTSWTEVRAMADAQLAAADAAQILTQAEEDVILTLGGLNEIITEQDTLLAAINASIKGPITDGINKWREALQKVAEATDETGEEQIGLSARADRLRASLEQVTTELIFQQAAANLDAEATLLLARELGLIDEATFAVAQEAQRLRAAYDLGAISAEEFAAETRILRDDVNSLTSKDITINIDTLAANRNVDAFTKQLAGVPRSITTVVEVRQLFPGGPAVPLLGLQEGGQFTIPDRGPMGDNVPVSFMAERGETVTVTPRDGTPPVSNSKVVNIGPIMVSDITDVAILTELVEQAVG